MQAEQQITALYDRLSRDDEPIGESNSIVNHLVYLGYAFNIHALQRMAGDMLAIRRGAMNGTMEELLPNAITGSTRVPNRSAEVHTSCPITFEAPAIIRTASVHCSRPGTLHATRWQRRFPFCQHQGGELHAPIPSTTHHDSIVTLKKRI